MKRAAQAIGQLSPNDDMGPSSKILREIVISLPKVLPIVNKHLGSISVLKAKENNKIGLWTDPQKYPNIRDAQDVSPCFKGSV